MRTRPLVIGNLVVAVTSSRSAVRWRGGRRDFKMSFDMRSMSSLSEISVRSKRFGTSLAWSLARRDVVIRDHDPEFSNERRWGFSWRGGWSGGVGAEPGDVGVSVRRGERADVMLAGFGHVRVLGIG